MNSEEYRRMYEAEDRHWWYVGLHELVLAAVERESGRLGRKLRIFDAGSGTGRLCQLLAARGHMVSGCDTSEEAIRFCRERKIEFVFQADLNTIVLEDEAFDVITSMDVLYHKAIKDDITVMKRLLEALKPGGLLLINLVAHEFLRSSHDIVVQTRERYTVKMLAERLEMAGYSEIRTRYRVCLLMPLIALYRLSQRLFFKHVYPTKTAVSDLNQPIPIVNDILKTIMILENSIQTRYRLPFGSSVFAEARKHHE